MIDTVHMMLMIMIARPIMKNIELKTNRLSVLPILPEAIPIIAQLTAIALLMLIRPSMLGDKKDPRSPPIPFIANAIPRRVSLTSISKAFIGMIGPIPPTISPNMVNERQYVIVS